MSDDLIERLRARRLTIGPGAHGMAGGGHDGLDPLAHEAADALAEARAEIARLKEQITTASFALGGHEVLEPNRFHSNNRNDFIACALWDLCKAASAALSPQAQEE